VAFDVQKYGTRIMKVTLHEGADMETTFVDSAAGERGRTGMERLAGKGG
jgi:hypothetical protein